jgi:hypothetical protein
MSSRGEPSAALPPTAVVAFVQNHDQVGNRAIGERLTQFARAEATRAVAATYLLLPQVPMLFMGDEWGAAQPFPFFAELGPELAEAARKGRRQQFAAFPCSRARSHRRALPIRRLRLLSFQPSCAGRTSSSRNISHGSIGIAAQSPCDTLTSCRASPVLAPAAATRRSARVPWWCIGRSARAAHSRSLPTCPLRGSRASPLHGGG